MKTKLILCLVCLCLFFSLNLTAGEKRLGALGGINIATLAGDIDGAEPSSMTLGAFGAILEMPLGEQFMLCLEPVFIQKGAKYKVTAEPDGYDDYYYYFDFFDDIEYKINASYFEIPILLKKPLGSGNAKPYILAGPSLGILSSAEIEISFMGLGGFDIDVKDYCTSFDIGLTFGGGIGLPFGNNILFAECRYTLGLTDIFEGADDEDLELEDVELKNRGIQIMGGFTFPLGN
ncbi:PorT family protein [bacterium]|nr:PorT family protein [bacterium]